MTPCVPLSVTFNSCCNSLGGEKKRYFTTDLHGSEVWGSSMLPWERASYGSLAVQIWLGSSWAVAAEFICCCLFFWFELLSRCACANAGLDEHLRMVDIPSCAFSGLAIHARKAHLHRITSESKTCKVSAEGPSGVQSLSLDILN